MLEQKTEKKSFWIKLKEISRKIWEVIKTLMPYYRKFRELTAEYAKESEKIAEVNRKLEQIEQIYTILDNYQKKYAILYQAVLDYKLGEIDLSTFFNKFEEISK